MLSSDWKIIAAALVLFSSAQLCSAQGKAGNTDADSAAIKRVFVTFYENFSRHDAHAAAMTFAEDADFTNMRGDHRRGRNEIEVWLTGLFAGNLKDARRTDIVKSIRFFSPTVASVDADTVITGTKAPDGSEVPPRKRSHGHDHD